MNEMQKSKLELECESIRKNIEELGKTYLLIAYKIYELKYFSTYKEKYSNISKCCEKEFGIKKSTTYNMLSIVERFGTADESGYITYNSLFKYNKFSYTQLSVMCGMSDKSIEKIDEKMSVSEIKKIKSNEKKCNECLYGKYNCIYKNEDNCTEFKKNEYIENKAEFQSIGKNETNIIDIAAENVEVVEDVTEHNQINIDLVNQQIDLYGNSNNTIAALIDENKRTKYSAFHFENEMEKCKEKLQRSRERYNQVSFDLENQIKENKRLIEKITLLQMNIDKIEKNLNIEMKQRSDACGKISILKTNNEMLNTKVKQQAEYIKKLETELSKI